MIRNNLKKAIRALYWKFAYDEADHGQRFVVAKIPKNADHDVIIGKLEPILRANGVRATSYVRLSKDDE